MSSIGEKIREARIARNINAKELGKYLVKWRSNYKTMKK